MTLKNALCGPLYSRSTWVGFLLSCFNQLSGVNAVNIYANRLLENLKEVSDGQFPITPAVGTYIIGFANFGGAFLAIFPVMFFGRKTLLLAGQIGMAVSLILSAIFL